MVSKGKCGGPSGPLPPHLWPDSFFSFRVNPANKVLLEQVVNVAPLVPWAPLDWLDPLASLDVGVGAGARTRRRRVQRAVCRRDRREGHPEASP